MSRKRFSRVAASISASSGRWRGWAARIMLVSARSSPCRRKVRRGPLDKAWYAAAGKGSKMHVHFETRRNKPPVFKITRALIDEAAARSPLGGELELTLGSDLESLAPLKTAVGLVTSNDVIRDRHFPLAELAARAPALRWINITGAAIEPLLPLDWLPRR